MIRFLIVAAIFIYSVFAQSYPAGTQAIFSLVSIENGVTEKATSVFKIKAELPGSDGHEVDTVTTYDSGKVVNQSFTMALPSATEVTQILDKCEQAGGKKSSIILGKTIHQVCEITQTDDIKSRITIGYALVPFGFVLMESIQEDGDSIRVEMKSF